ncbi:MAG TPA: hypothetical protein VGG90_08260 [Candidatus Dormibacteraeota bacterium]
MSESPPRTQVRATGVVAAILTLLIISTLVFTRLQSVTRGEPSATPTSASSPTSSPVPPTAQLPQADLDRAHLNASAADLIKPLNLVSTSSGRTITLIGAYADPAETILFLRTTPNGGYAQVMINDDLGLINAASTGSFGSLGDQIFILDGGPHAGSNGMAQLSVKIFELGGSPPTTQRTQGNWTFSFPIKVQPSTKLTLDPAPASIGIWKVSVEAAEVTPSVIHFQAVIDGALVSDMSESSVTLLDANGQTVQSMGLSAAIAIPKQELTSTSPRKTRVNVAWARPSGAGSFQLRITGGGGHYLGSFSVPAPAAGAPRKGYPVAPTDFPASDAAIDLSGAFSARIATGHPSQCGYGAGPSGSVFAFATWVQVNQVWYLIEFTTDPSVRQYHGPGTYTSIARIWPYAPYGADPIFAGTAQLTVSKDKSPDAGSVQGTLTWTAGGSERFDVMVSGTWTCTSGAALGPG